MLNDTQQIQIILYTSSLTILGGIIVFVVSQFLDKLMIEPLNQFEKSRGEINYHLLFFANQYLNPGTVEKEELIKSFSRMRELSAKIITDMYAIHGYGLLVLLGMVPDQRDVILATNQMFLFPMNFPEGRPSVVEIQNSLHKISALLHLHEFAKIEAKRKKNLFTFRFRRK